MKKLILKYLPVIFVSILLYKYSHDEELRTLLIFVLYLILSIIHNIDPRYPIIAAIGCLILSAVLLSVKNEVLANKVAIYAYYFLVVGVILNIIEYIREEKSHTKRDT